MNNPRQHNRAAAPPDGHQYPPPQRPDEAPISERAILGLAVQGRPDVLGDLTAEDIADPRHRAVLVAVRAVAARGPVDPGLVVGQLHRDGVRPDAAAPWAIVLADLVAGYGVPAAAPHHRRCILEARLRRDAVRYLTAVEQATGSRSVAAVHDALVIAVQGIGSLLARIAAEMAPSVPLRAAEDRIGAEGRRTA